MENTQPPQDIMRRVVEHEMANLRATLLARGYGNLHHVVLPYPCSQAGSIVVHIDEDMGVETCYDFTSYDECRDLIRTIETFCLSGPMAPIRPWHIASSASPSPLFPRQPGYILQATTAPGGTNGP